MNVQLITVDPEIHSGTPVFAGTRVPIQILFDHMEAGDPLEVFLEDFPSVSRELAITVLEEAKASLMDIRPIRTEADYESALDEIASLMGDDPPLGTPAGDRLDVLTTLVQAYEAQHRSVLPPDPIDAIKLEPRQDVGIKCDHR